MPIVIAVTSLVVVIIAVVAIVLSTGGEAHTPGPATVTSAGAPNLSVGPKASTAPSVAQSTGSAAPSTSSSSSTAVPSRAAAPERPAPLSTVVYRGTHFTAQVPAGWSIDENETPKEGYVESKWHNPARSGDSLLVDFSPAPHLPLEQDAAPVHKALQRANGYRELAYEPGDLAGTASWDWIFQISGDQRVDYFFEKCTTGFAVLGSTTPARFAQLQATFRAVAESVQSTCRGG